MPGAPLPSRPPSLCIGNTVSLAMLVQSRHGQTHLSGDTPDRRGARRCPVCLLRCRWRVARAHALHHAVPLVAQTDPQTTKAKAQLILVVIRWHACLRTFRTLLGQHELAVVTTSQENHRSARAIYPSIPSVPTFMTQAMIGLSILQVILQVFRVLFTMMEGILEPDREKRASISWSCLLYPGAERSGSWCLGSIRWVWLPLSSRGEGAGGEDPGANDKHRGGRRMRAIRIDPSISEQVRSVIQVKCVRLLRP